MDILIKKPFASVQKAAAAIFCVLMISVSLSSCGEKAEKEEEGGWRFTGEIIYAEVENALEYSNIVEVKLMLYVPKLGEKDIEISSGIWEDGSFAIELPKTIDQNYLDYLQWFFKGYINEGLPETVTFSNERVKSAETYLVGVDKDGNGIASFSPKNGDTEAIFIYADSDVTFSGYLKEGGWYIIPEGYTGPTGFEINTTLSVNWRKGWNVWFHSKTSEIDKDDNTEIITQHYSTSPVSGLKWYGSEYHLWRYENFR